MKVYLVTQCSGDYDTWTSNPLIVFSTKEKAEEFIKEEEAKIEILKKLPEPYAPDDYKECTAEQYSAYHEWDNAKNHNGFNIYDFEVK